MVKLSNARQAYLKARSDSFIKGVQEIGQQKEQTRLEINELRRRLVAAIRRGDALATITNEIKKRGVDRSRAEIIGQEFDTIASFPNVKTIDIEENWLVVTTNQIRHRRLGRLGTFKIFILLVGGALVKDLLVSSESALKIRYVDWQRDHLHVYSHGLDHTYCLGNAQSFFLEALERDEIPAALEIILRFLEEG